MLFKWLRSHNEIMKVNYHWNEKKNNGHKFDFEISSVHYSLQSPNKNKSNIKDATVGKKQVFELAVEPRA